VELGPDSLALLGADSGVQRSKATTPPRLAIRPRENLSGSSQKGNRAIAVIGLPRLFEASVCSGLSEDSNGAGPTDPLHAIYGTRPHSLLLLSVGAGQTGLRLTTRYRCCLLVSPGSCPKYAPIPT
jgi:hypothetical protein